MTINYQLPNHPPTWRTIPIKNVVIALGNHTLEWENVATNGQPETLLRNRRTGRRYHWRYAHGGWRIRRVPDLFEKAA